MTIIAGIAWILIWGLAGYLTVRAVLTSAERHRAVRTSTVWFPKHKAQEKKNAAVTRSRDIVYNPFEGLL